MPTGHLYSEAKRSQRQFPRNTLIATRSLASLCCDLLSGHDDDWPTGLDEKIRALDRARRINHDTREQLYQLRKWGNRAAHPEAGLLSAADQHALAVQALAIARALLETVFQHTTGGGALLPYVVAEEHGDELREACYRALVDNSPADQHQIAMLLQQQLAAKIKEINTSQDPDLAMFPAQFDIGAQEERVLDLLRYASDAGHAPARYQYGLALAEGQCGGDKVIQGINLIALASRDGEIDAMAWCGRAALYGLHDEPVDYDRARGLLAGCQTLPVGAPQVAFCALERRQLQEWA